MFAEVCREAVVACPLRQYGCLEMLPRRNIAQHLPVCAASGVLVSGVAAASPVARLFIRVSVLACAWPARTPLGRILTCARLQCCYGQHKRGGSFGRGFSEAWMFPSRPYVQLQLPSQGGAGRATLNVIPGGEGDCCGTWHGAIRRSEMQRHFELVHPDTGMLSLSCPLAGGLRQMASAPTSGPERHQARADAASDAAGKAPGVARGSPWSASPLYPAYPDSPWSAGKQRRERRSLPRLSAVSQRVSLSPSLAAGAVGDALSGQGGQGRGAVDAGGQAGLPGGGGGVPGSDGSSKVCALSQVKGAEVGCEALFGDSRGEEKCDYVRHLMRPLFPATPVMAGGGDAVRKASSLVDVISKDDILLRVLHYLPQNVLTIVAVTCSHLAVKRCCYSSCCCVCGVCVCACMRVHIHASVKRVREQA